MEPWLALYTAWNASLKARGGPEAYGPGVAAIYHPLDYAWEPFSRFLAALGPAPKRLLFLGMNPGPWGMTQTGVPFGSVPLVRGWMGLDGRVGRPAAEHPARPVEGFACRRTEVSGARFWGLMRDRFGSLAGFAADHAVHSFLPLVFMDAAGRNVTPDKLPRSVRRDLEAGAAQMARSLTGLWQVEAVACLGRWAYALACQAGLPRPVLVPHPSPIHPGSRDWSAKAEGVLVGAGLWAPGAGSGTAASP